MTETQTHERQKDQGGIFWAAIAALILIMLVLGWYFGKSKTQPITTASNDNFVCEAVPDGMTWTGEQLVETPRQAAVTPLPAVSDDDCACANDTADAGWLGGVRRQLTIMGYPSMDVSQDGANIHVTGSVPTQAEKAAAFDVARRLILNAPDREPETVNIINDITVDTSSPSWVGEMQAGLRGLGFDWLNLSVRGSVATLSGTAPDAEARASAFDMASAVLRRNAYSAAQVSQIIDGISVEGGDAGVSDALVELSNSDDGGELTVEACQVAFIDTMAGRNIEFETASAALSGRSTRLLDALAGIAVLCTDLSDHSIEIGGHTDSTGAAEPNQILSEQRASSVRDYMIGLGVEADKLTAVGYGESRLLDTAETAEAHARNRRTEFTVMASE